MIRAVISDLGKVLITFDNSIFYKKIAPYTSLSIPEIAERVSVHSEIGRAFDVGALSPPEFYDQVLAALQAEVNYDEFCAIYNDVFDHNLLIIEILRKLKNRYRLVMLSNTDILRFGFIREKFPEVMFFDSYVLSYEVGTIKPDSRIYEVALQQAQAGASECVFIDDREENIKAANELGIHTIHFLDNTDLAAELQNLGVIL